MEHFVYTVTSALAMLDQQLRRHADELQRHQPADADAWAPSLDRALRSCYEQTDALRRYLILFRSPRVALYDPLELFRAHSAHFVRTYDSLAPETPTLFSGDAEQIAEAFRLIRSGFETYRVNSLTTRIYIEDLESRLEITLDDDMPAPTEFGLTQLLTLSVPAVGARWSAATSGGRLTPMNGGIRLTLAGGEPIPPPEPLADAALPLVRMAAARLMPWRGAIGHFEPGQVDESEWIELYRRPIEAAARQIADAIAIAARER